MVKVSVIMSVYSDADDLRQAIDSFCNQTLDDIELICISNRDIVETDSIRVYPSDNQDSAKLRKKAVGMASGDCIAFLDDNDSFLDNGSLEKLYDLIYKNDAQVAGFSFSSDFDKYLLNKAFPVFNTIYKKEFLTDNDFALDFKNENEKILFNLESIFKADKFLFYRYNEGIDFEFGEVEIPELFGDVRDLLVETDSYNQYIDEFNLFKIIQAQNYLNESNYDHIRREFIDMDLNAEKVKDTSFDLYRFYIHVLNNHNKDVYDIYEERVNTPLNYIDKRKLDEKIYSFNEIGINPDSEDRLIVSMTSYPARMHDIHYCLYSLFTQSLKPYKIILWLAESQFPNKELDLPDAVLRFRNNGLTIRWCEDLKSYKKLIPILKECPDDYIVTVDDDIYYPEHFLENIWMESQMHPDCIISSRARKIELVDNDIADYWDWKIIKNGYGPAYKILATGAGGILYPPHAFTDMVFDRELYEKLCPSGDDMWFWAMAVLNETRIVNTKINLNFLKYINIAREIGILDKDTTLWNTNKSNHNNIQMRNLINHFPEILKRITEE